MMNDNEKNRVENCVVQIECVHNVDRADIEYGTGFFIGNNVVVTASHVISKYYENPSDYFVYIIPIKVEIERRIKVEKILENRRNNFISILQLEETLEVANPLKFTSGYNIKRGDEYFSFGHPHHKRLTGYSLENKIATPINEKQSKKINWDLSLTSDKLEDFRGFSGSPVIVESMLVGIVQTQSEVNGKTISIGMSSVEIMSDFIPKIYFKSYNNNLYFKEIKGIKQDHIFTIDDIDTKLRYSTEPSIGLDFFEIDDEEFKQIFNNSLDEYGNIYVVGKSREEALYCILNELKYNTNYSKIIIVSSEEVWEYLRGNINGAILIPNFYVGEIVAINDNINIFIYGEDEHCTKQKKIELKRRTKKTISDKLKKAGLDSQVAYNYVQDTNGLFISLKRKLFNGQYNTPPKWYKEKSNSFIAAILCGKWTECEEDKIVLEELSGKSYDEFMKDILPYIKGGEPLIIEVLDYGNKHYQLANVEVTWEYLDERIHEQIWDKFVTLSYELITKIDPIFNNPSRDSYKVFVNEEKSINSNLLKSGMIRSMIFRCIYRKLGYQYKVDKIVRDMLITIDSIESWAYFSQFILDLCEASPKSVIERLEDEIKKPTGLIDLFSKNSRDVFKNKNYYTNILWGIEQLLLYKEYAVRAVKLLFIIDSMDLIYHINNSPKSTLQDIFCAWYNITVLTSAEKVALLQYAINKYKNTWNLIFGELPGKHKIIHSSLSKPRYREFDKIELPNNKDVYDIYNEYAILCINNIDNDIDRWLKVINEFSIFPNEMLNDLLSMLVMELEKISDKDKQIIKEKLRDEIYRHRYFSTSNWAMEERRLKTIEKLCISIVFEDKIYDYLYLFKSRFNMPILNPIPYDEENKISKDENESLREKEIKKGFNNFRSDDLDIIHLIKLADVNTYNNLGTYIAMYYTEGKFDYNLYKRMINIKDIEQIILSYIFWIYKNCDKSVIKKAKSISRKYDDEGVLYVNILKIQDLRYADNPQIMNEDEHVKHLYWSEQTRRLAIFDDKDTLIWVLTEFKKYNNIIGYVEYLYEGLRILDAEEVLKYVTDLKKFNNINKIDSMISYYLKEIMDNITTAFVGRYNRYYEISSMEMFLIGILEWEDMKCTQYIFKNDSSYYAQIIDLIFLHEGEEQNSENTHKSQIIKNLFRFYYDALFCPCENNGEIKLCELKEWVNNLKNKLDEQIQSNLLGAVLGRLFAYAPMGKDGYHPHESIREIIEELGNDSLITSYLTEELNKRGVYSPDGGKTEKKMALRYKENANGIRILYSESAKIYDVLHESYSFYSEVERRRAEDIL